MRFSEIIKEEAPTTDVASSLMGVLQFLRNRSHNYEKAGTVGTDSLINMVRKTGVPFDYEALVAANDSNDAVKNLISNISKDLVTLKPFVDDEDAGTAAAPVTNVNPETKVDAMAKRALAKRQ